MKQVLSFCALFAVFLAVSVAFVGKYKPEIFMHFPPYGFILWILTGNYAPPYFGFEPWEDEEYRNWLRDGDLVAAIAGKSGTTWMLYCTHNIRVKGEDWDFNDLSYTTPWPEFIQKPGLTWEESKQMMNDTVINGKPLKDYWDHPSYPFRIFKSHYTPLNQTLNDRMAILPVRQTPNVKYLAMARNGLDTTASFVPFFCNHDIRFRSMWGGFPHMIQPVDKCVKETKDSIFQDMLPNGNLRGIHFDYVKQWWPYRHDKNVLLLHYADMKRDLKGGIAKIAKFLDVELSADEFAKVEEKCSFPHMKKNLELFGYKLPLNDNVGSDFRTSHLTIRKGENGDGKATFTPEQIRKWIKAEEMEFSDPEMREWARNGGEIV